MRVKGIGVEGKELIVKLAFDNEEMREISNSAKVDLFLDGCKLEYEKLLESTLFKMITVIQSVISADAKLEKAEDKPKEEEEESEDVDDDEGLRYYEAEDEEDEED